MKIPVCLALLIAIIFHAHASIHSGSPQHHKVRHKHNLLQFSDHRVNEIREAFDDYKNVVQKPKVSYDDAVMLKPLRHHRRHDERVTDELTQTANGDRNENGETSIANPQVVMARYKRVHTTETTTTRQNSRASKFSDNYDEEYDDDEDKTNQKVNQSTKVQVSCVITRLIKS